MLIASEKLAQRLAIGVPALLRGGAYVSQYGFGLVACEMCWWQRYAHFAAVALALASTVLAPKRVLIALAGLAILVAGLIGGFHAGVEYGWWEGFTTCSSLDLGSVVSNDAACDLYLFAGLSPVALFDGLADAGNGLYAVTRVHSGSIDLMSKP